MSVKASISLTEAQEAFARELVADGRYPSRSAVLQQGCLGSGARINVPGKTVEPVLRIPSAFQNPLAQTPDRHRYTHP